MVPFGLCNAPATFQRMINRVLSGLLWKVCLAYLDDIVIFSENMKSHLEGLEDVFRALERANLRLKPEKCKFAQKEIKYLGHVTDRHGRLPRPRQSSRNLGAISAKKQRGSTKISGNLPLLSAVHQRLRKFPSL